GEGMVAGTTGDDERIGRLRGADGDELRQAGDRQRAVLALHLDVVVALGAVDGHAVRRAVAGAAAGRRSEVNGDLRHAGAGKIVDGDVVGTTQGVDLDGLDAVEVHGDVAEIAGEPYVAAVGRDVDVLADVGAVEPERVGARLALDPIAAVAGIPLEYIVASAEKGGVVPLVAVDEIVAIAAEQEIGAIAAQDRVVAGPAVNRHANKRRKIASRGEGVVATVHVDNEVLGCADIKEERRGLEPVETHARAVGRDREGFGAVATVDLGGVGAVAALEQVAVVARVPDHAVVAAFAEHLVVAIAAGQHVVAG